MQGKLSVVMPVHNEAETLGENVLRLERYLKGRFQSYEIVLSEDGSTDGTIGIMKGLASKRVTCLHDNRRLGKGAAILRGFSRSTGDSVFIMDADLPAGVDCIQRMVGLLEDYDMVLASRLARGSEAARSGQRKFLSRGYNVLARLLFRTGVHDHQCGVKAIKRTSLREIAPSLSAKGFFWDTEMVVRARQKGFRIKEFPVKWLERPSGKSSVRLRRDVFSMGTAMVKFWIKASLFRE